MRRQVLGADQVEVERGCPDVGEHPARGGDLLAVGEHDRDRAPVAHLDARDPCSAADLAAARGEPADQRSRELTRAALGHREADLLPQPGEEPSEEPTRRHVGPDVTVHGVAGQQQCRALAAELLLGQAADRQERLPDEVEEAVGPQRRGQAQGSEHRGERRHHRGEQRTAQSRELRGLGAPRVAVTGGELPHRCRGLLHIGGQHRAPAVSGRVGQHRGRTPPPQPVGLEVERAHDRRRRPERVEGAEQVVHVPRVGELAAADGATGLGLRLEHEDLPAGVGEHVGGDETIGTGPDHDCVDVAHRVTVAAPGSPTAPRNRA